MLRNAVRAHGRRWTEIVERYFGHRTPIATRNRYLQAYPQSLDHSTKKISNMVSFSYYQISKLDETNKEKEMNNST